MDCAKCEEVIFLYADDQLEQEVVVHYHRHIEVCPTCAHRAAYTIRLLTVVRTRCRRASAPERLRRRIVASLRHRDESAR